MRADVLSNDISEDGLTVFTPIVVIYISTIGFYGNVIMIKQVKDHPFHNDSKPSKL